MDSHRVSVSYPRGSRDRLGEQVVHIVDLESRGVSRHSFTLLPVKRRSTATARTSWATAAGGLSGHCSRGRTSTAISGKWVMLGSVSLRGSRRSSRHRLGVDTAPCPSFLIWKFLGRGSTEAIPARPWRLTAGFFRESSVIYMRRRHQRASISLRFSPSTQRAGKASPRVAFKFSQFSWRVDF